jgi:hypothetical protein
MLARRVLLLTLCISLWAAAAATAADWPFYLGANRDNTSADKDLDGQCWTMPVVANGRVYCRSHAGELVCLDLR